MVARRTDARRRRVLSEEFVPTEQAALESNRPMQAYSFGANRRNQPKTTDLIPKRAVALVGFFLLIVSGIAALNALAWYAEPLATIIGEPGARALSLFGPGTLANWCCSISLFLCGGICVQLYLLRQHKRDDYGGMYRVWILMALMFVVASIDCAIDLRSIATKSFEFLTHRSLAGTPWLMLTIEMIVLAIIVLRMLFEVRASKFSLGVVLLVWVGFVGCIVLQNIQLPESLASVDQSMAYGNCMLLGCIGSLVALTVYTRFVFLHAHGLLRVKVKPEKVANEEQTSTVAAKPAKSKKRTKAATQTAATQQSKKQTKTKQAPATAPASKTKPKPTTKTKPAVKSAPAPQLKPKQPEQTTAPQPKTQTVAKPTPVQNRPQPNQVQPNQLRLNLPPKPNPPRPHLRRRPMTPTSISRRP